MTASAHPSPFSHERYCAEIAEQTGLAAELLTRHASGLTAPVPSCPGWNVGQLARHLGGGQRWAEETVRTRAAEALPDGSFRELGPYANEDAAVLAPWLREGGIRLAGTLRAAGPEAAAWTPFPAGVTPASAFFARRFTHETVMHRADATLALGEEFTVADDVATDGLDEWLQLGSVPEMLDYRPEQRELLAPGRTIRLRAPSAAWRVDLTGDRITWYRETPDAAGAPSVSVAASLADLLLLVYRRRTPQAPGIEVTGDATLLDAWLERVSFG